MSKSILLVLFSICIISCTNYKKEKQVISLKGNWEYDGFGKAITINDSIVKSYHISSVGNVPLSGNSVKDYFDYYTVDTLSNDVILLKDGVKIFKLFRSSKDFESRVNTALANDPIYNFEVLWNTFNEQYCYFKERNIDWKSSYDSYKSQVTSETTPLELYLVFENMMGEINDSHISINLPDALEEAYEKQAVKEEEQNEAEVPQGLEKKVKNAIIEKHLKNVGKYNNGELKWGMVSKDVGYIQTSNMISFANYNLPDTLSSKDFWNQWWKGLNTAKNHHDDVANGTRYIMDSISKTLGNAKACIVDLRFNGGGFDDVSVEILNHFVKKKTDICTKKVRLGEGFTEKQKMTLIPSQNSFNGRLYVLTSSQTASAAELLVLGAREVPNATIVGATTEGVFSDILHKKLPNGWKYGLSNMIYETMDGTSFENIGIVPDLKLNYPTKSKDFYEYLYEDIKDGDDAIEAVIAELEK